MLLLGYQNILMHRHGLLPVFKRKVLRKIFDPVRVGDDFRARFNYELYELLNDMDVVQRARPCRWNGGEFFGETGI